MLRKIVKGAPRISLAASLSAVIILMFAVTAAAVDPVLPPLYAVNVVWAYGPTEPTFLYVINPVNGTVLGGKEITVSGEIIDTTNGMAIHPTSDTVYAAIRFVSTPSDTYLTTIDPETGTATIVGGLGDMFSSIAFGADGTLYGVTGRGGTQWDTLYTINLSTAAVTQRCTLSSDDRGHALSFGNGLIYHATATSSYPNHVVLETIDPATFPADPNDPCTVVDIPFSASLEFYPQAIATVPSAGAVSQLFMAAAWGRFFAINIVAGVASWEERSTTLDTIKGLAFADTTPTFGDLQISTVAARRRVKGTKLIDYTITLVNAGSVTATDVVVRDVLPAGFTHLSDESGCVASAQSDQILECSVGTLAAGQTKTMVVKGEFACKKCGSFFYNWVTFESWRTFFDESLSDNAFSLRSNLKGPWK